MNTYFNTTTRSNYFTHSSTTVISVVLFVMTMMGGVAAAFASRSSSSYSHIRGCSYWAAGGWTSRRWRMLSMKSTGNHDRDGGGGGSISSMPTLPEGVVQYSQVPKVGTMFTATTIPKGLLKEHSTKAGTWGVIRVKTGQLEYQINESPTTIQQPQPQQQTFILTSEIPGIIPPTIRHQVRPLTEDLEFCVDFHRFPGTGPVDEKRE